MGEIGEGEKISESVKKKKTSYWIMKVLLHIRKSIGISNI